MKDNVLSLKELDYLLLYDPDLRSFDNIILLKIYRARANFTVYNMHLMKWATSNSGN